jgi:predicted lysophospholipase L1 biosynthesis ABC-type transport system permease subunit
VNRLPDTEGPPPGRSGAESMYLAIVAGLLVLILALLATLWLRERSARLAAQRELGACRRELREMQRGRQQREAMLQQLLTGGAPVSRPAE